MPDTVRTLAALQTLLADNTAGDIGAQDVRDMLVSVFPYMWRPATAGAYDDMFDADNESDWTAIDQDTGTTAWNYDYETRVGQGRGVHIIAGGGDGTDGAAYVKPVSGVAIGDYVQTAVSAAFSIAGNTPYAAVGFADGNTSAANVALGGFFAGAAAVGDFGFIGSDGTLANLNASTFITPLVSLLAAPFHIRCVYSASNTFQLWVSLNGEDFIQVGIDIAHTMTPTHAGFVFTDSAVATSQFAHFKYFHSDITP